MLDAGLMTGRGDEGMGGWGMKRRGEEGRRGRGRRRPCKGQMLVEIM
jgi:hypothetical protein